MAREVTITCPDNESVSVLLLQRTDEGPDGEEHHVLKSVIKVNGDKVPIDQLAPIIRQKLDEGDPHTSKLYGGYGDTTPKSQVSDDPAKNPQIAQAEQTRATRQTQNK